ncbi:MAG: hypothetical protein ACK55K_01850 [Bacteroidota bacterium]|jgi:hypothetical protein
MAQLIIHNSGIDLKKERVKRQREKTAEQRFDKLIKLNQLALLMSGRKILKALEGKGLVLRKIQHI